MPNIKSAIKRVTTSQTRHDRNIAQKNEMRTAVKKALAAKSEGSDNAQDLLNNAIKLVDKANQSNLIHTNKAARLKSKLMSKNA